MERIAEAIRGEGVAELIALLNFNPMKSYEEKVFSKLTFEINQIEYSLNDNYEVFSMADYCNESFMKKFVQGSIDEKPFEYFFYDEVLLHNLGYEIVLIVLLYKFKNAIDVFKGPKRFLEALDDSSLKSFLPNFKKVKLKEAVQNRYDERYIIYFEKRHLENFIHELKLYTSEKLFKEYEGACHHFKIKPILPFIEVLKDLDKGKPLKEVFKKRLSL